MKSSARFRRLCLAFGLFVLPPLGLAQDRTVEVHDPVLAKEGDTYYVYSTGKGIRVKSSKDLVSWKDEPPVFAQTPDWLAGVVQKFDGRIWAPDIFYHGGLYHLYYSVSAFGRNTSAIGVATNTTLDPASPHYAWKDHGIVVRSVPGRDLWNAIDANVILDERNTPWMTFGSFWTGIKLVKLNPDCTSLATGPDEEWHTLASRPRDFEVNERDAGDSANPELDYTALYTPEQLARNKAMQNGSIEAPFLFRKDGLYYLFVSWDRCCQGVNSTYKILVGRAKDIRGPYLDQEGKRLVRGGGTVVASGDGEEWAAAGHCAAYALDGKDYLVFHAYDLKDKGKSKLRIREIQWVDGWPQITLGE